MLEEVAAACALSEACVEDASSFRWGQTLTSDARRSLANGKGIFAFPSSPSSGCNGSNDRNQPETAMLAFTLSG